MFRRPFSVLGLITALALVACPAPATTLSVSPTSLSVTAGGAASAITATTSSSDAVQWVLTGPGTLSTATGATTQYTPPAKADVNSTQTATIAANVTNAAPATVSVTINPAPTSLTVNVSGLPNGTNAAVTVTGPSSFSQTATSTKVFENLAAGPYTINAANVSAGGVTYKPTITGSPVTLAKGDTKTASVVYAPMGSLTINVSGLPTGVSAAVTVTGTGFSQAVTGTQVLNNLPDGTYTVTAADVSTGGQTYKANVAGSPVVVSQGNTSSATVTYAPLGSLSVTVTGLPGGVNANVSVTGPGGFSQAVQTTTTFTNAADGAYSATASNVVSGGITYIPTVTGSPATVSQSTVGTITVAYVAQVGILQISISGVTTANVTVTGPNAFTQNLTATTTLSGRPVGIYNVIAADVTTGGFTYKATVVTSPATVTLNATTTVTVTYVKQVGKLQVNISGLPAVSADVTVTGPNSFNQHLTASLPATDAPTGTFNATANDVSFGGETYKAKITGSPATLALNGSATITVVYAKALMLQPAYSGYVYGWLSSQFTTGASIPGYAAKTATSPEAIAIDASGNAWVSLAASNTIVRYGVLNLEVDNTTPVVDVTITLPGTGGPSYLAFDPSGNLWVVNSSLSTLYEFIPAQLATTGTPTPTATVTSADLSAPTGLAFDASGNMWVGNYNTNSLTMFTKAAYSGASGATTLAASRTLTSTLGGLNKPYGLAFNASGNLWVANQSANTVVEFVSSQLTAGGAQTPTSTITANGTSLVKPTGLAFDWDGNLWVANADATTNTVVKLAAASIGAGGSVVASATLTSNGIDNGGIAFYPVPSALPLFK